MTFASLSDGFKRLDGCTVLGYLTVHPVYSDVFVAKRIRFLFLVESTSKISFVKQLFNGFTILLDSVIRFGLASDNEVVIAPCLQSLRLLRAGVGSRLPSYFDFFLSGLYSCSIALRDRLL